MGEPADPNPGGWPHAGRQRPAFAHPPGPGQESVWDYPRPPRLVAESREVVVSCGPVEIARTTRAVRILETASPPTFYLPRADVHEAFLEPAPGTSWCEWKGEARYWSVVTPAARVDGVAWSYPQARAPFTAIRDMVAFYPAQLTCTVDGEVVRPQPGGYYGGWVTSDVAGPFKGEPGTGGW
jgi:uncharacterized protein (DUF427 family)